MGGFFSKKKELSMLTKFRPTRSQVRSVRKLSRIASLELRKGPREFKRMLRQASTHKSTRKSQRRQTTMPNSSYHNKGGRRQHKRQ